MAQPVRIAIAGAGMIGQAHIKRVLEEPQAELAAIIDPSPNAKEQAAKLRVPIYADLDEALRSEKPDGVVIATPNQLHVANGLSAVRAGVPMLLEKPVSGDVESAMELVNAAEAANVPILVGHHRRHSPLIQRAKEIVGSGRLGKITAVNGLAFFASRRTISRARAAGVASPAAAWCSSISSTSSTTCATSAATSSPSRRRNRMRHAASRSRIPPR